MSIPSRATLATACRSNGREKFAGCGSASIGPASTRVNNGARRVAVVGAAVLAALALGSDPEANATPSPACLQGPTPTPGPGCGRRAFLTDIAAAGLGDNNGGVDELDQGFDICGLMDSGLSRQKMVSQFAALNPGLGPDGAAQVVRIAIRDLCPWHSAS
jgi:Protein of unknown function (DUF732)